MKKHIALVLSLVIAAFMGCNFSKPLPDGMPSLSPFDIIITQDGTPLEGAVIYLHSDVIPYIATGKTDETGKASMITQDFPGVPDGEFKVVVIKEIATPSQYGDIPPTVEAKEGEDPAVVEAKAYTEWEAKRKAEKCPTHSYVNKKYGTKESTDLTVNTAGSDSITLDVGPAVDDVSYPDQP